MAEVKFGLTSHSTLQSSLFVPGIEDQETITALVSPLLREMKEKELEAIKTSRHSFENLKNSYTILNDGTILCHFHSKDKQGTEVLSKEEGVLIPLDEHHIKSPKKMFNLQGEMSHVLSIFLQIENRAIPIQDMIQNVKEISRVFSHNPFILKSHCLEWRTKDGFQKQGIISRYVGTDLYLFLRNLPKKFDYSNLIDIMLKMSNLVKTMHDKNWAHFDLKPENFLIEKGNNRSYDIYLIDFDFSLELKDNIKYSLRGTEEFLAPELIKDNCFGIVRGKKADIYSLGRTFLDLIQWVSAEASDLYAKRSLLALSNKMCMQTPLSRPSIDDVIASLSICSN